jgi:diguanylate cyclase (GGDEF)-like protein
VLSRVFGAKNVYRIGGDEFLSVAEGTDEAEMAGLLRRVEDAAAQFTMADKRCDGLLSLSSGAAAFRPGKGECFHTVFVRADEAMYRTKAEHHDAAAR